MNQIMRTIAAVVFATICLLAYSQSNKDLIRIVRYQDTLELGSLIGDGFDINGKFNYHSYSKNDYLLNISILCEQRELTEFILKQPGAKKQLVEKDHSTTLHYLVRSGWYDLARDLIESGIDPNTLGRKDFHILRMVLNNYGWTDNPNDVDDAEALDFIKFLYSNGIDPALSVACCKKKITILSYSVQTSHFPTVEYILEQHQGSINDVDDKGKTALHWAVELEQMDIVSLLIENGADPQLPDKKGNTPINYAQDQENKALLELLEEASITSYAPHPYKSPRSVVRTITSLANGAMKC